MQRVSSRHKNTRCTFLLTTVAPLENYTTFKEGDERGDCHPTVPKSNTLKKIVHEYDIIKKPKQNDTWSWESRLTASLTVFWELREPGKPNAPELEAHLSCLWPSGEMANFKRSEGGKRQGVTLAVLTGALSMDLVMM